MIGIVAVQYAPEHCLNPDCWMPLEGLAHELLSEDEGIDPLFLIRREVSWCENCQTLYIRRYAITKVQAYTGAYEEVPAHLRVPAAYL